VVAGSNPAGVATLYFFAIFQQSDDRK